MVFLPYLRFSAVLEEGLNSVILEKCKGANKMCQLLGLSSNKEVDIQLSLREFSHRGKKNRHGWGFA